MEGEYFFRKVRNGRSDEGEKILSKLQGDIEDPIYKELKELLKIKDYNL